MEKISDDQFVEVVSMFLDEDGAQRFKCALGEAEVARNKSAVAAGAPDEVSQSLKNIEETFAKARAVVKQERNNARFAAALEGELWAMLARAVAEEPRSTIGVVVEAPSITVPPSGNQEGEWRSNQNAESDQVSTSLRMIAGKGEMPNQRETEDLGPGAEPTKPLEPVPESAGNPNQQGTADPGPTKLDKMMKKVSNQENP